MHDIEPFYAWRHYYCSEDDIRSPFHGRVYSETEFTNTVYNFFIHPQWDEFGSNTLYVKIIFADYDQQYTILELIGEWNDCLYNDIMFLKRNVIELMMEQGIVKFMLIGENVFNFHYSDDSYYQEWFEEIEGGWIVCMGFLPHAIAEFKKANIHHYMTFPNHEIEDTWRTYEPSNLFLAIEEMLAG